LLFAEFPGTVRARLQMFLELDAANEVKLAVEVAVERALLAFQAPPDAFTKPVIK
jgi:hypothetical protein